MAYIEHAPHISKTSTEYLFKTISVLQLRLFRYSRLCVEPDRELTRAHHWFLSKTKLIKFRQSGHLS